MRKSLLRSKKKDIRQKELVEEKKKIEDRNKKREEEEKVRGIFEPFIRNKHEVRIQDLPKADEALSNALGTAINRGEISINAKDNQGRTILRIAAMYGYPQTVEMLLENGAVKDKIQEKAYIEQVKVNTIFWPFVSNRDKISIKELPEKDEELSQALATAIDRREISINAKDHTGRTQLSIAVAYGYPKTVEMLLGKGARDEMEEEAHLRERAKVNAFFRVGIEKKSPEEDADLAKILKEAINKKEIDKDAKDKKSLGGSSLLYLAVNNGYAKTARMLLEEGANVAISRYNSKPIDVFLKKKKQYAKYEEYESLGKLLIAAETKNKLFSEEKNISLPPLPANTEDLIKEKRDKLLKRDVIFKLEDVTDDKKQKLLEHMGIEGTTVNKEKAEFRKLKEENKDGVVVEKYFLQKPNSVESKFGSDIFRVLSAGRYAAKREILEEDKGATHTGGVHNLIKWDQQLAKEPFLHHVGTFPNFDINKPENHPFLERYARMCGVLHVLGESDSNPGNFLLSKKTNKPVKIDNSFLVNYFPKIFDVFYQKSSSSDRFKIYGSAQSRGFLLCILAGREYSDPENEIFDHQHKIWHDEEAPQIFSPRFIDAYNVDIYDKDESLLKDVKNNIDKPENTHLKACFMEFMSGIKDSIKLAEDTEFLKDYCKKYHDVSEELGKLAENCHNFFKENANQAKVQFSKFLKYYETLLEEEKLEQKELEQKKPLPSPDTQPASAIPLTDLKQYQKVIAQYVKCKITDTEPTLAEGTQDARKATEEQKIIIEEYKKSLFDPEVRSNPRPNTSYCGIGVKAKLVNMGEETQVLQIDEIFALEKWQRFKLFKDEYASEQQPFSQKDLDKLNNQFIAGVYLPSDKKDANGNQKLEYSSISAIIAEGGVAKIANIFHQPGEIRFKMVDEKGENPQIFGCMRNPRTAFVTNDCKEALTIDARLEGAQSELTTSAVTKKATGVEYNPEIHGTACLYKFEERMKEREEKARNIGRSQS